MNNQIGVAALGSQILDASELGESFMKSRLEGLKGKRIIFSGDRAMVPLDGWGTRNIDPVATITTIRPVQDASIIAAVDSSSIKVADTEDGALYAAKCGVAFAYAAKPLMHFKIGPILFYISESGVGDSVLNQRLARLVLLDSDIAKRLIRVRMERSIQIALAKRITKGIILVDGSLKSSQFEKRTETIQELRESCALNRNSIVGLSKGTKLKILERVAGPLTQVKYPSYLDVDLVVKSLVNGVCGNCFLVKLSATGPVLRADVVETSQQTLGRIIGNDSIGNGYPETLRLAHHVSTFSSAELISIKTHVIANYDVTELAGNNLRESLLGSMSV